MIRSLSKLAPPTRRSVYDRNGQAAAKAHHRFAGVLSPPAILGAVLLIVFGVGIIDSFVSDEIDRLRSQFVFYQGLSLQPILYLIAAYLCFVAGYKVPSAATLLSQIKPAPRRWDGLRVTVVTTVSFLVTFSVLVAYTIQVGYGRFEGNGNESLENLSLLGELSLIPCVFSLVRYFQIRRGVPGTLMSRWDIFFLWGVMFPAQLILSVVVGTRSRVVTFLVVAIAAYHFNAKRLRLRTAVVVGVITLAFTIPALGSLRAAENQGFSLSAGWQSIAGRTSAVESLTIIYENLDTVPSPDPFYWTLLTGLVPRFVWPGKPQSLASERLTYWAIGRRGSWAGPTLPGELLMLFGHLGGLIAMAILGGLWRLLEEAARVGENSPWIAIYIVALPTLLTAEVGFVSPYSVLTRLMAVTLLLLYASTKSIGVRSIERRASSFLSPRSASMPSWTPSGAADR